MKEITEEAEVKVEPSSASSECPPYLGSYLLSWDTTDLKHSTQAATV